MLSLFRKFISNSNESSQVPFVDETFENKLEIFVFNLSIKEWLESVSGTIFIEKLQPPKTSLMIIKIDSHPYHLIRKITRDFKLFEKDEKTWMFRVYEKTKSSDYNESTIIACRFSTKTAAIAFHNFIKNLQTVERAGFENLNFRLEIIRKTHEEELIEKECALSANFPSWDDLLNGKYYQNFYNNIKNSFRCMAEIREFDNVGKKWKKLILGLVKIDVIEDNGQSILTVIENSENFVSLVITRDDVELIALDNRTWMWRGYKKCESVQSLLIGCRFINSKIARNFGIEIIKAQEYAPLRCTFRDEYMRETFKKEFDLKLAENQIALECNFPGEYEIIDNTDNLSFPSTSFHAYNLNKNKIIETLSISSSATCIENSSNLQILLDFKGIFYLFDSKMKKWNNNGEGTIRVMRNGDIPNIWISMKTNKTEFVCKLSQDLELMKKDSRSFMWRVGDKKETVKPSSFLLTEFECSQVLEEFEKRMKDVQGHYSLELLCDEFELDFLKKLFEMELEEKSTALVLDFPSHVDLAWLSGSDVTKYRANNISETDFIKGSVFHSKVDIYKFDVILNEWKKLTALPGSIVIKVKQFQEFQKTLIYAISDEFQGTITVKCEIASNLNLEIKDKNSCIWRGYVEMNNGKLESLLIACRFTNFHIANNFKATVADVVQKPLRCFLRDEYLSEILKNEREQILDENQIALNSSVEKE